MPASSDSGRAEFVIDLEDKAHGLNLIMHRYTGNDAFTFTEAALEKTCVIRITVDEIRGKRSGL